MRYAGGAPSTTIKSEALRETAARSRASSADKSPCGISKCLACIGSAIVPDADPQARTFRVLFKIPNEDNALKPGMSVTAELPTSTLSNQLTVPKDAVHSTPTGTVVTLNRNNTAAPVPVTVRFSIGDRFVIDGPINHNDQVVIEGNERLAPGQPLNIVNPNEFAAGQ